VGSACRFTVFNGALQLNASDGHGGRTVLVKDIFTGAGSSEPAELTVF
jgi:ELWxxDGT repeat protein